MNPANTTATATATVTAPVAVTDTDILTPAEDVLWLGGLPIGYLRGVASSRNRIFCEFIELHYHKDRDPRVSPEHRDEFDLVTGRSNLAHAVLRLRDACPGLILTLNGRQDQTGAINASIDLALSADPFADTMEATETPEQIDESLVATYGPEAAA